MQPASLTSAFRRNTALVVTTFCLLQAPLFSQSDHDQALNTTYQTVLAKLTPAGREQLRKIERAWLAFIQLDRAAMRAAAARLQLSATDAQNFEREEIDTRIWQLEQLTDSTPGPEVVAVFRQNDGQLNVVYQRCITSMTPAEVDALRKAQRAWLVFREESRKFGGLIGARITAARTEQLNAFYIQSTAQAPAPQRVVESMERPKADRTTPDPFERAR